MDNCIRVVNFWNVPSDYFYDFLVWVLYTIMSHDHAFVFFFIHNFFSIQFWNTYTHKKKVDSIMTVKKYRQPFIFTFGYWNFPRKVTGPIPDDEVVRVKQKLAVSQK